MMKTDDINPIVHIRTLMNVAHGMAVVELARILAVHGGKFTFLPEERPGLFLDLTMRQDELSVGTVPFGWFPVDSLEVSDCGVRFNITDGPSLPDSYVQTDVILSLATGRIPSVPVDYEAACKAFKRLAGAWQVPGNTLRFDAEKRTITCDDGDGLTGTKACLAVLEIVSMIDDPNRTRTRDQIVSFFYEKSGIGLPF